MKKLLIFAIVLALMLPGCGQQDRYSVTYLDLFDTVTTITGYGPRFQTQADDIYEKLLRYHQLFDIYHDYEGLNNLKTINDQAGIAPVVVEADIIALLQDCKAYFDLTGGRVNVAMGSVLRLWHEARQSGALPAQDALSEAARHRDWAQVIIDEAASTVYIADEALSLDVGAIAKGWACQRVASQAAEGLLISLGGNVCATGPKDEKGTPWRIGVQDPAGGAEYLRTLSLTHGSVVTSGDYQRTVTIDGVAYHHIIDPDTLMPAAYWRSVTVVCPDSGLADALSTALFLLPLEEGKALAESCGAQALWVDEKGEQFSSLRE